MKRLLAAALLAAALLATALLAAASAQAAEVYRWVDAEGRVHFGDRPPQEAEASAERAELKPINSADAIQPRDTSVRRPARVEQQYESRKQQQQQRQQQQMAAACREARNQLRILQGPVYFVDADGREVQISERERRERAQQLEHEVARACSSN